MKRTFISDKKFADMMTDPLVVRPRGKQAFPLDVSLSVDERSRPIVNWTCPIDGYRNHHYWFGRSAHICNKCDQPTDVKGTVKA